MTPCEMRIHEDAEVAYSAYREHTGGVSLVSLEPIPEWEKLTPQIQWAWKAAAHAMREIMFCPPHWRLEHTDRMEPFTQCIACTRAEVNVLRQRHDFLLESNNRLVEERRAAEANVAALRAAGEAVVDRWDSPMWKYEVHTGEFILALRTAIAAARREEARNVGAD
jgi:hypothetical protein